jgi:hypothetical protein
MLIFVWLDSRLAQQHRHHRLRQILDTFIHNVPWKSSENGLGWAHKGGFGAANCGFLCPEAPLAFPGALLAGIDPNCPLYRRAF